MKLSVDEKHAIEKICAISGKDRNTVKDVLKALLIMSTLEIYMSVNEDSHKIIIPYLCNLDISQSERVSTEKGGYIHVELDAHINEGLQEEIQNIAVGNLTPSKQFIKKKIVRNLQNILEIDEELEDE